MKQPHSAFSHFTSIIASVAALLFPVWLLGKSGDAGFAPVRFLFSGAAFAERPLVTGGALDQFSLHKEWFILVFSLVVICPCITLVRRINRNRPAAERCLLAAASLLLLVHPLSILTVITDDIFRYLLHMGFTLLRVSGLALALLTYLILALFACWISGLKSWRRIASARPDYFNGHGGCNRPPR